MEALDVALIFSAKASSVIDGAKQP
jgi:hypothetical protein